MTRPTRLIVLSGAVLLALAACASQPAAAAASGAPGFWWGLLHGWIAPFALVGHIFDHDIRVYAFPNSGGWYDFGFLLGVGMLGGGAASSR
jgi:hypothetical protein